MEPYLSNDPYCGVCLKTTTDSVLLPNSHGDFFAALQEHPPRPWLCVWCERRIRGFAALSVRAHCAERLLALIHNTNGDRFCDDIQHLQTQIDLLKRESLVFESLPVTSLGGATQEDLKVEDLVKRRGRPRKREERQDVERVEIKVEPALSDDDSYDMIPLKRLKDKGEQSPDRLVQQGEIADSILDANIEETSLESVRVKVPKAQKAKNAVARCKRKERSDEYPPADNIEGPKSSDIMSAIEELDNESFIVSEEVHRNVETINSSEAGDKQRAQRLRKPSYVNAAYRCVPCVLGYQTKEEYDQHMHHHSPSAGPHRCHPCGVYFSKHRELERHIQSHYRRHRCLVCRHGSVDYRAAVKHYISQHSRVSFTCWLCNKEFRRPINLKKHLQKNHKGEEGASAGCAVCAVEFPDEDKLQEHMKSHKPSEIIWHECHICRKKSRNAYHMRQHVRAHEREFLPIVCDICRKTFKTHLLLATHIQRLHTDNSKKYQCDECGKFFYDKGELRIHVQWTHKREGGVECCQCQRKFRTAYLLNDHIQRVHDNIPKPKDKLCDFCGRGFASRKSLKSHRYIHTGERPHACPDCGQTFRQRCAMRLHHKSKHLRLSTSKMPNLTAPDLTRTNTTYPNLT